MRIFLVDVKYIFHLAQIQTEDKEVDDPSNLRQLPASTQYFSWSCKQFLQPVMQLPVDKDPVSEVYHQRQFRYLRNSRVRGKAWYDQHRAGENFSSF